MSLARLPAVSPMFSRGGVWLNEAASTPPAILALPCLCGASGLACGEPQMRGCGIARA